MCKYSFIMPAYKAKYLKEAINSVLAQTFKDFELIIVNDASPEPIEEIVKSYNDCRIKYYKNEVNIGGSDLIAQWNKCLSFAKGEYVILAPDDDVYHKDFLKEMDLLIHKYPECHAFRSRVMLVDDEFSPMSIDGYMPEYIDKAGFLYYFIKRTICTGIGFWVFHRESLLKNGGYENMPLAWWSDDMTAISMADAGVAFSPKILFYFRHAGESISNKRNKSGDLKAKLKATQTFYQWLKQTIDALRTVRLDDVYQSYPYDWNAYELYYGHVKKLIDDTGKIGILKSLPDIIKMSHISTKSLILIILLSFLKK